MQAWYLEKSDWLHKFLRDVLWWSFCGGRGRAVKMVPVSRETHAGQLWRRLTGYSFAARESFVPIGGAELARAAATMPTAFLESSGEFIPVALLSLAPGTNLFVAPDGRWLGAYIPVLLRCYPFRLLRVPGTDKYSLCADSDADQLSDAAASTELYYDSEGHLAPATKAVFDTLAQFEQNRLATAQSVAVLVEAKVLCPWPIRFQDGDKEKTVTGLHRIDEKVLAELSDELFLRIRKAGALPVAYAQLLSMAQLGGLSQLAELHKRLAQGASMASSGLVQPAPRAPAGTFTMVDPETLRFD